MGELKNKVQGNVKSVAGRATGNDRMTARGEGQKAIGRLEEGGRKLRGTVEEGIGRAIGSPTREARGKARRKG